MLEKPNKDNKYIPTQVDNFSNPRVIHLKICGSCPLTKNVPTRRLVKNACIYMVSVKKFQLNQLFLLI